MADYNGTGGDDTYVGTSGNDTIHGNGGNDDLTGNGGVDVITGDEGNDFITVSPGHVDGGAGNDTLRLTGPSSVPEGTDYGYFVDIRQGGAVSMLDGSGGTWQATGIENVSGGQHQDLIYGGVIANIIAGEEGSDIIRAYGGDDLLLGDGSLRMVNGQLVITETGVGAGEDTLDGGDGNDRAVGGAGNDFVGGGAGNDILEGNDGADIVNGGVGDDLLYGGAGRDRASFANTDPALGGVSASLFLQGNVQNLGLFGMDLLVGFENLSGTAFSDTLTGDDDANWLWGAATAYVGQTPSANHDTLYGLGGDDLLMVGTGDHILDGGAGADSVIYAQSLFDMPSFGTIYPSLTLSLALQGGAQSTGLGSWTLTGVENLGGWLGNDQLTGDLNGNVLAGSAGSDTLVGGGGDDLLLGDGWIGIEADLGAIVTHERISFSYSDAVGFAEGRDILDGGEGNDRMVGGRDDDIYYVDSLGDQVVEFAGEGNDEVRTGLAAYTLAADVEMLTGTGLAQVLTGNNIANTITGGTGNDLIDGGLGADAMAGGLGNDIYLVDDAGDTVTEGDQQGLDEVRTNLASYSLAGVGFVENLTGGAADQSLTGNGFDNVIDGGAGADAMAGGGGHDVYIVDNLGDSVTEADGAGTDEVRTSLGSKSAPGYALYVLPNHVENLTGTSAGAQGVRGNALNNAIVMGAGADLIVLDDGGIDSVDGGGGNDFLFYGATLTGADTTNGGAGTDTLGLLGSYTGASAITFTAANLIGVERLALYTGGGTNSYSVTMNDANVVAGGELFVTAASLNSAETLFFNGSAETNGRFTILGGSGGDTLVGGRNGDYLAGNAGNDMLYALAGNDFIIGGLGADQLTGGGGHDAFRYLSTADSTTGSIDQILDFTDLDRIDLSAIDANNNAGDGDTAFTFIGSAAFTNIAGQLRASESGGVWTVEGDVNGDGAADLVITVNTVHPDPLTGADFVL